MSDSIKDRITTDLQKAKDEGGTRAERIREIIQGAASQTMAEVKEGSGTIGTIARDALSTVVRSTVQSTSVKDAGEKRSDTEEEADQTAPPLHFKTSIEVLFKVIKDRLFAQIENRVVHLDNTLMERYADRYASLKQRLGNIAVWYSNARANAETPVSDVIQQKQAEIEIKVGEAGTSVARKELQIRQQLKDLLHTAAARL
jgi:hypothetical protein